MKKLRKIMVVAHSIKFNVLNTKSHELLKPEIFLNNQKFPLIYYS